MASPSNLVEDIGVSVLLAKLAEMIGLDSFIEHTRMVIGSHVERDHTGADRRNLEGWKAARGAAYVRKTKSLQVKKRRMNKLESDTYTMKQAMQRVAAEVRRRRDILNR